MAPPTITVSPAGGVFTANTAITITASRPGTIFYCMWPQAWAKTAPGQTSVQITATESGSLRCFVFADDTIERSATYVYSFTVNPSGGMVSVYRRLGHQDYASPTRLWPAETGSEWAVQPGTEPMYIGQARNFIGGNYGDPFFNPTTSAGAGTAARKVGSTGSPYGSGTATPGAAVWTGATMGADQQAHFSINVPFDGTDQWVGARCSPSARTGYVLYPWMSSSGDPLRHYHLVRQVNGVDTGLVDASVSGAFHPDDFSSFDGLIVTGTNPVRIRVVCWCSDFVAATPEGNLDWSQHYYAWLYGSLYDFGAGYGSWLDANGDGIEDYGEAMYVANPPPYLIPGRAFGPGSGVCGNHRAPGFKPGHFKVLAEYLDSSPQRILGGQPAFGSAAGSFDVSHFYASEIYELTATAGTPSGGSVVLSGTRVPGSVVTVTRR
jgi:hypothetical protein